MRPKSIQLFERLYLASIALTLIATALGWDALVRNATIPGAEGGAAASRVSPSASSCWSS
jgi:hypothetical protein